MSYPKWNNIVAYTHSLTTINALLNNINIFINSLYWWKWHNAKLPCLKEVCNEDDGDKMVKIKPSVCKGSVCGDIRWHMDCQHSQGCDFRKILVA